MTGNLGLWVLLALGAAALCSLVTLLAMPILRKYALAHPNQRSSHKTPTPIGGGAPVLLAVLAVAAVAALFDPSLSVPGAAPLLTGVVLVTIGGISGDLGYGSIWARLLLQALGVAAVVVSLPAEMRIVEALPLWAERAMMLLGGVWFINLCNFMDGLDWLTVAEIVPVTAGLAILGWMGALPPAGTAVAIALCGAMLGFAPFNRPVAKLFLGDVGSLPIGLITFWLLILLAGRGHWAAACLLPLYYLTDATVTLLLRFIRGERVSQAHRQHFYQRAYDNGMPAGRIVGLLFLTNNLLVILAAMTVQYPSGLVTTSALAAGAVIVAALAFAFTRRSR